MAERIPDLWRLNEDAPRIYHLYVCRLKMNGLHERVVTASRQIRRYAARGPGHKDGLFTFSYEIDSLCELNNYKAAWRQLRVYQDRAVGERFDLAHRNWSVEEEPWLTFYFAPLLFYLKRYRLGCSLLETALSFSFDGKNVQSYDLLFHVYNDDEVPRNLCRVTLAHFYTRLGKRLHEWRYWEAFVNGFHSRLFRLAGVGREELLADSQRLPAFFDRLMAIRAERTASGYTRGQADLIQSLAKVKAWHEAQQRKTAQFDDRIRPTSERHDAKLLQLFPELRNLRR
jgi:hypothetical protein